MPASPRPPLIPPHIAWPGAVVGLLLMTLGLIVAVITAARSDGGAVLVENYYQEALAWDATQRERAASEALGWNVALAPGERLAEGLALELTVTDRDGLPVVGLDGTVAVRRADEAAAQAAALAPTAPGVYRQVVPVRDGVYDVVIDAQRGNEHLLTTLRRTF